MDKDKRITNCMLPEYIFYTGAPGSIWSGIAQDIKAAGDYDCTDRADHRVYTHGDPDNVGPHGFSGHCDAYYGTGMEFACNLDKSNLDAPFSGQGTKLLMSHEWPYYFDDIIEKYPDAWIQLVYRNNIASFDWWKYAGGWDITYPNYNWYEDDAGMRREIKQQNYLIVSFVNDHKLQWSQHSRYKDVYTTTYKP